MRTGQNAEGKSSDSCSGLIVRILRRLEERAEKEGKEEGKEEGNEEGNGRLALRMLSFTRPAAFKILRFRAWEGLLSCARRGSKNRGGVKTEKPTRH